MSHECPECGQWCYCDGEDHGQPAPDDCSHDCGPELQGADVAEELDGAWVTPRVGPECEPEEDGRGR